MTKISEEDIREHIQSIKFKNYTFEERLKFINLHRVVFALNSVLEDVKGYFPIILYQDPYEEWKFIICLMPYDLLGIDETYNPNKLNKLNNVALEFKEGSEYYYSFDQFCSRMDSAFKLVTFYDGEGEPFETEEVYRLFFQAMRHVEEYAEESIIEWATRLQEKNFFPVTDELTDEFVAGRKKYEYESEEIEEIERIEEMNEYLLDEEDIVDSDDMDEYSDENEIDYEDNDDYYDSEPYEDSYGGRSPNDQRSDVMNPNNDDYKANNDNRSNQMNPNNSAYRSSRGRR